MVPAVKKNIYTNVSTSSERFQILGNFAAALKKKRNFAAALKKPILRGALSSVKNPVNQ